MEVTVENNGTDYAAVAVRAFDGVPKARHEGVAEMNDFDLAYRLAQQELVGTEVDTNALFFALTAESEKRAPQPA